MKRSKDIALAIFCLCSVFVFSQNSDPRFAVADSLLTNKAYKEALKLSLQLAEAYPKNAEVFVDEAYCYNGLGEDQKTLAAIEKALSLPIEPETKYDLYYLMADSYEHLQNQKEALNYCEKYLKHKPKDSYALNLRGWLFYTEGNYDKAIADFEEAMKDTAIDAPEKTYALALLGSSYLQEEDLKKARLYDSLALTRDQNDYDANFLLANITFSEKDFTGALNLFEHLFEKDTSNRTLLFNIADCYYALKNYDKAISNFKTYLIKYPESSDVNNTIAWILFLQKKYLEGLPYANKAIVQDNANVDAYDTRGCILYKKGEYVNAVNDFNKSLKLDKAYTNSYYFRGLCFLKTNQKAEACKDFEKVKEDKSYELKDGELPVQELISMNCGK